MRISASGRVTIPEEIRRQAGLSPGIDVDIDFDGESIRIMPSSRSCATARPLLSPEEIRMLLSSPGGV